MPRVLHDVSARALQVHGSLGLANDMPFMWLIAESFHMGLADGPTEVHKVTLARQELALHEPSPGAFPTGYLPPKEQAARERFAEVLERHGR